MASYFFRMMSRLTPAALVLLLTGCGGAGVYPVRGRVVFKDNSDVSVLARGQVIFDPAEREGPKVNPRGEIDKGGSFTMSTYKEKDGVVPGKYRIRIVPPPFFGARGTAPPELFDGRFEDSETSGLIIDVTGPVQEYVITVEKPSS